MLKRIVIAALVILPSIILLVYFHSILTTSLWGLANDPGLGWHLKTGEIIVNTLQIPHTDPFLLNGELFPWVSNQWLADVVLYVLYDYGSWPLLYGLIALGLPFALWGLLFPEMLQLSRSIIFVALSMIFVITLHYVHFFIRPVFFQLVFFILLTSWLYRLYSASRMRDFEPGQLIFFKLTLLILIWANVHPSFIIALGFIFLLFACLLAEKLDGVTKLDWRQLGLLGAVVIICLLVSGLNPYFFDLHRFILFYMTGNNIRIQDEWGRLEFDSEYFPVFLLLVLIFLSILYLARRNLKAIGLFPVISVFPFLLLSLAALRYLPFFGVVTIAAVAYILPFLPQNLRKLVSSASSDITACLRVTRYTLTVGLVLIGLALTFHEKIAPDRVLGPDPESYPDQAVAWLNQKHSDSAVYYGVLNSMNWGGFISLYGANLKPTVDDRLFFFSSDYVDSYLALMRQPSKAALSKILTVQHDYILVEATKALGIWLAEKFPEQILFRDGNELLLDGRQVLKKLHSSQKE